MKSKSANQYISRLDCGILCKKSEQENTLLAFDTYLKLPTNRNAPRQYVNTPEQIAQELRVDENGLLWYRRNSTTGRNRIMNKPVGGYTTNGYLQACVNGEVFQVHTLAFCLYYGRFPGVGKRLDHINGITTDNRINNLREVSAVENGKNRQKLASNNASGYHGVSWDSQRQKWVASIHHTKKHFMKRFDSLEEALACRADWEKKFGFTPVRSEEISEEVTL